MVASRAKSQGLARQDTLAVGTLDSAAGHISDGLGTNDRQLARNLGWAFDLDQFTLTGLSLV